jgi:hypothetical protein
VAIQSKYYPDIYLEELGKTTIKLRGEQPVFWSTFEPKTS